MAKKHNTADQCPVSVVYDDERREYVLGVLDPEGIALHRMPEGDLPTIHFGLARVRTVAPRWQGLTTKRHDLPQLPPDASERQITAAVMDAGGLSDRGQAPTAMAIDWTRLPQGVAVTEVPLNVVHEAVTLAAAVADQEPGGACNVETRTRAIVRFYSQQPDPQHRNADGVAFLTASTTGHSIALWSPAAGFVFEAEQELSGYATMAAQERKTTLHEIEFMVADHLNVQSLQEAGLPGVSTLVVAAGPQMQSDLRDFLEPLIPQLGLPGLQLIMLEEDGQPVDIWEAMAVGLLAPDSAIPRINLADELPARIRRFDQEDAAALHKTKLAHASRSLFAAATPLVVALTILLTSLVHLEIVGSKTDSALDRESREAARLKRDQDLRKAVAEDYRWYLEVDDQIISLRNQQPAVVNLLLDLDGRWPRSDPYWTISQLKADSNGAIEVSGRTRSQDSVKDFATQLEFGGDFSGIQPEMHLADADHASAAGPPPQDDPVEFTVRATYAPLIGASVAARPVSVPDEAHVPPQADLRSTKPPVRQETTKGVNQ